jgi:16S rRNA processing protein RimM
MEETDLICVGIISSPHGINGHIKIKYYTENPKGIISYGTVYNKDREIINLKYKGISSKLAIYEVENISDRNEANLLKGEYLFVKRKALPKLKNDEIYHIDLIGLKAINKKSQIIGTIENVSNYGAGDILEIKNKKKSFLVPLISKNLDSINLKKKSICLSNLDQWLNINEEKN